MIMTNLENAREELQDASTALHNAVIAGAEQNARSELRTALYKAQFRCYEITGNVNDLPAWCEEN